MATRTVDQLKAIRGFGNPQCYARALTGCSIAIDGEHAISKTLLEALAGDNKAIMIANLPWQKDPAPQAIAINSLNGSP